MTANWYDHIDDFGNCCIPILQDLVRIQLNDSNLKPGWIAHPAEFTEFHIQKNKKSLVLVIGESWTYGESLPDIASSLQQYNLRSQLTNAFGPQLAVTLDTDYYQYAVPGNCNFYMFKELDRILNHLKTFNYEKIYLCMQMTEPAREKPIISELGDHPLSQLYSNNLKIDFIEWIRQYDTIFFNEYDELLTKHANLNIDAILWKNFCSINADTRDYLFKIIETTWIQYSSRILGEDLEAPMFYSVGWVDSMIEHFKNITYDKLFLLDEMNKIEKSNNFIKGNSLHTNHPTALSHLLWFQYIARKSGWKNGI